jgi:hypothetical protein
MRRAVLPLLILATVLVAALLAWLVLGHGHFRGPGRHASASSEWVTESRQLGPFNALDIAGIAEVTLVQGDTDSVTFDVPRSQLHRITATVRGDTLELSGGDAEMGILGLFGRSARPNRINVTFRKLEAIEASGAVKLNAARLHTPQLKVSVSGTGVLRIDDLQTQSLKVSGSGAFKAELAGKATEQVVAVSGAGKYEAAQLESDEARVAVSGAGKVVVNARKSLKVGISGAGIVEYLGDPEVKQSVSGLGKVRRRESAQGDVRPSRYIVADQPTLAISATSPRRPEAVTPA